MPEVKITWNIGHQITTDSELFGFIDEIDFNSLKKLNGKIRFYARGFDSITNGPQINYKDYSLSEIKQAALKSFVKFDENGKMIQESINWNEFDSIIENIYDDH